MDPIVTVLFGVLCIAMAIGALGASANTWLSAFLAILAFLFGAAALLSAYISSSS
jgi:hypothetical protein